MQLLTTALQSARDVLAAAWRATPFQVLTAAVTAAVALLSLGMALFSLALSAITFYRTHIRGARLFFFPADGLNLLRQPAGGFSAVHLMGTLANDGGSTGVLTRLEADIRDPANSVHRFVWDEFYRYKPGGREFDKVSDPVPVPVKPGEAVPLFVQLRPVDGRPRPEWPSGKCLVSIVGWVNAGGRSAKAVLSRSFHISIDSSTAAALREKGTPDYTAVFRVPVAEWQHSLETQAARERQAR
jgi:hypothetical protein